MYLDPNYNVQGDLVVKTDPSTKVVSVDEIKSHLRIDTSDEDTLLGVYIDAATEMAEHYCTRHFIEHEYKLYFNTVVSQASLIFPDCTLLTTPIHYIDTNGVEQTSSDAYIDAYSNPSICYMKSTFSSPTLSDDLANTFWIEFKTGFGATQSDVPQAIQQAIKLIVADMYYFREDRKRRFPMASEILLQPYKCFH